MLKPKRKISKKELKTDPFLVFLSDAQNWFTKRKSLIYRVAIGLVVIFAVIYFTGNSRSNKNQEAEALLGKALLSQDLGDSENTRFQLQTLIDDYSGTKAGKQGYYYFGKILYDDENYSEASDYLLNYVKDGKTSELLSASFKMLASISRINNDNEKAENYLLKGVDVAQNTVFKYDLTLEYAKQLIINNKTDKALKIIDDVLKDDNILFSTKQMAEELKGRIVG